ncbi:MAG TPA: hypothetical protein DDX11_02805 [Candidatus Peribacter riflensis]|uniref:Glycerophosphoryl diester phosphodiesterase membrane domain-containing protein n=1 Tax=Candidatus Peribacter riflensis TaxID=1735162 RepID=A0A0S1SSQ7_9BACT|nr:MAG: Uncharacterized protein PeribacterA2_0747 [Candidatus Peribacter riflensis]OGJ77800.1 MAG: hypothetical protein A2398_00825 [Candidatus Peribacteria bacterium RIFOXYB1_FULL_57_12]OGJ80341.1 MAG: hypothetical protein A2412_01570 [Candidatus Peribacteria bacterium RIFOXYC1_FULL_58_8]ALM11214.1 MAG: Uncharacterized protein PeribacterB2_0748 [Candidatus Peribacter riflensis]ALM12317.1 MAG: Uncharacterized protein PeribacterC2_0748 [Candidatus Peribacter riflensis]
MNPREIIAQAWAITLKERQLRKWGFASSLLETLLNTKLLIYQTWFVISYMQGDPIGFFADVEWLSAHLSFGWVVTIVSFFGVLIFIEWLFPHFAKGAIVGLAAKSYKKEEVKGGLVLAVYNFFPLFAIHEFFFIGSISMVITLGSVMLRYAPEIAPFGIFLLCLFFVGANILRFFFIMSEEGVVIRKLSIGKAMAASFKLVISYLGHVVFLLILGFLISLRIFANALMIFLVPGIVIGIAFLFGSFLPFGIAIAIGAALGLIIIGLTSYLFAYLEVFRQNVWTITYLELSKLKELDVIES